MKRLLLFSVLIFVVVSLHLSSTELKDVSWVRKLSTAQDFEAGENYAEAYSYYRKVMREIERIDPKSTILPEIYNRLGDVCLRLDEAAEGVCHFIRAMNHSEIIDEQVVYAYKKIHSLGLILSQEVETRMKAIIERGDFFPSTTFQVKNVIVCKLNEIDKSEGVEKAYAHLSKHNLIKKREDLVYTKNLSFFREKACCSECEESGGCCEEEALIKGDSTCTKAVNMAAIYCKCACGFLPTAFKKAGCIGVVQYFEKKANKCCKKGVKHCMYKIYNAVDDYMYDVGYSLSDTMDDHDIVAHINRNRRRFNIPDHSIPAHSLPEHYIAPHDIRGIYK